MGKKYWFYLLIVLVVTAWSGYHPFDQTLWYMETFLCLIGVAVLIFTFKRFRFTDLTYIFITLHLIILMVGAHYSYSRVPLFDWLQEVCGSDRNNFDKLGHFAQGFVPAFIVRELLIRLDVVRKYRWIPFFVICTCLSISAFYELTEWWGALLIKQSAEDFLGTQGYEWDTQSDMLCALIGASCMLLFFSKIQDKQMKAINNYFLITSFLALNP